MAEQDEPQFPNDGILWRGWSEETLGEIAKRGHPVLLFVADPDPFVWPFLREIFKAMPANAALRALLKESFMALFIKADELPQELKDLGAGSRYHIAILSPYGLTPMVTVNPVHGNPAAVVDEIASILERLAATWR
ncbi:MAG: hypothetical protein ACLQF2_06280 [Rhodomicrobium sp.]